MSTLIRIFEANCFSIAMTQVKADFRLKQKVLTDSHSRVAHVITVLFRVITLYFHEHHFEIQQFAVKSYQTFHSLMIFQQLKTNKESHVYTTIIKLKKRDSFARAKILQNSRCRFIKQNPALNSIPNSRLKQQNVRLLLIRKYRLFNNYHSKN